MHFWWPNKALWELDQIRQILVSIWAFWEQKREEERRREEEEEEEEEEERYGTRILCGIIWLFGYLFEFALGLVWILVCSISRV